MCRDFSIKTKQTSPEHKEEVSSMSELGHFIDGQYATIQDATEVVPKTMTAPVNLR